MDGTHNRSLERTVDPAAALLPQAVARLNCRSASTLDIWPRCLRRSPALSHHMKDRCDSSGLNHRRAAPLDVVVGIAITERHGMLAEGMRSNPGPSVPHSRTGARDGRVMNGRDRPWSSTSGCSLPANAASQNTRPARPASSRPPEIRHSTRSVSVAGSRLRERPCLTGRLIGPGWHGFSATGAQTGDSARPSLGAAPVPAAHLNR